MIKILHLSTSDIACDSRIIKSLQAAKDNGFLVKGIGIYMEHTGQYIDSNKLNELNIISLKLFFRKFRKIPASIRHFLVLMEYYIKAFKLALKNKPDLLHCNDEIPLPLAVFVSLFTKSKIIYDAHELESEKNGLSNFKKKIILKVEKMFWGKIDGLIVVSPSIKKWYEEKFPNIPTRIVLNAPVFNKLKTKNDKYFHNKYKLKDNDIVFLYIGAFLPGRGLELVAQEIGIMKDCHIVYLGYGSEKNKLLELSKKYNNIHIHDAVEHQQVVTLAQSADVGLCLIENISLSDYYCLPNKLFEYIFSKIPILASNFPDIRDVLSNYNIGVCVDLDPISIKSGVELIIKDYKKYKKNLEILDFSSLGWNSQANNIIELYKEVLGN
jgi:glycosyltransferase involved in cell wall biosynthesis